MPIQATATTTQQSSGRSAGQSRPCGELPRERTRPEAWSSASSSTSGGETDDSEYEANGMRGMSSENQAGGASVAQLPRAP
eukprot:6970498-Heterocapsa_arctica.AAC.1